MTRNDLATGLRAAQAIHAAVDWVLSYPDKAASWHKESNYVVVLVVENEVTLQTLLKKANAKNINCKGFLEPDLNNQLTSIALEPNDISKKLCRGLKLLK